MSTSSNSSNSDSFWTQTSGILTILGFVVSTAIGVMALWFAYRSLQHVRSENQEKLERENQEKQFRVDLVKSLGPDHHECKSPPPPPPAYSIVVKQDSRDEDMEKNVAARVVEIQSEDKRKRRRRSPVFWRGCLIAMIILIVILIAGMAALGANVKNIQNASNSKSKTPSTGNLAPNSSGTIRLSIQSSRSSFTTQTISTLSVSGKDHYFTTTQSINGGVEIFVATEMESGSLVIVSFVNTFVVTNLNVDSSSMGNRSSNPNPELITVPQSASRIVSTETITLNSLSLEPISSQPIVSSLLLGSSRTMVFGSNIPNGSLALSSKSITLGSIVASLPIESSRTMALESNIPNESLILSSKSITSSNPDPRTGILVSGDSTVLRSSRTQSSSSSSIMALSTKSQVKTDESRATTTSKRQSSHPSLSTTSENAIIYSGTLSLQSQRSSALEPNLQITSIPKTSTQSLSSIPIVSPSLSISIVAKTSAVSATSIIISTHTSILYATSIITSISVILSTSIIFSTSIITVESSLTQNVSIASSSVTSITLAPTSTASIASIVTVSTTSISISPTTSLTTETPPSQSLGCWQDFAARIFPDPSDMLRSNSMNVITCSNWCNNKGTKYWGTEYATQCFCGDSYNASETSQIDQSLCDYPCTGNQSETCGGPWALQLYSFDSVNVNGVNVNAGAR